MMYKGTYQLLIQSHHISTLKWIMLVVFMPQKSVNTTTRLPSSHTWRAVVKYLSEHHWIYYFFIASSPHTFPNAIWIWSICLHHKSWQNKKKINHSLFLRNVHTPSQVSILNKEWNHSSVLFESWPIATAKSIFWIYFLLNFYRATLSFQCLICVWMNCAV
jgi:hypothetical protein